MKALIYFKTNVLKPVGGPAGYLYNLKKELDDKGITNIDFIEVEDSRIKKIFLKLPKKFQNGYRNLKKYKNRNNILKLLDDSPKLSCIDFNNYDIIHFHSTTDMYSVKDSLIDYRGSVFLTSHTPKANHKEIVEDLTSKKDYQKHQKEYDALKIMDEYSFNRADYIIFPTETAEEPYFNTWPDYENIKLANKNKYLYLPTGISDIKVKREKEEIRRQYNIPDDAFVISYVGRHNETKGYDNLLKIGKEILEKNKNCYILVAGKEEPLKGLNNERWIEVGWTNDPHSIIAASDVFVLPNKETYFDLVLLEVLSIGVPVVLTNTGGNKYFKSFKNTGILYYEKNDIHGAVDQIEAIYNQNKSKKFGDLNRQLFLQKFTIQKFADDYLNLLNSKYEERMKK